jgi:hypothetical protein
MVGSGRAAPIRFDRLELAGAFGDIGTDLPLIVGIILATGLDAASALIAFGAMQVATAVLYRMPMPVQPLKAMAAIVIAGHTPAPILLGAGLAVGLTMLVLATTGLLGWVARAVPRPVIRGIQFGLGLQLSLLACRDFLPAAGAAGYVLAGASFLIVLLLGTHRRWPSGLIVIGLGVLYAAATGLDVASISRGFGLSLPAVHVPTLAEVATGFVLLAIPQVPLSIGNSILATRQVAEDLFPERRLAVRRIGLTYAAMNLINPFISGIPTCHGSGGMAGHYAFGGRTGGSVVLYGAMYLAAGLFFAGAFTDVIKVFPMPVLGILLLFEGLAMMWLLADVKVSGADLPVSLLVGIAAVGLPYGYLVGLVGGSLVYALARSRRARWFDDARAAGHAPAQVEKPLSKAVNE